MTDLHDDCGEAFAARWPPAELTPTEFERFVADFLATSPTNVDDYRVTAPDTITGSDGTFVFDATVRYRLQGLDFLTVIEAKQHSNPIKREVLQILLSKAQAVGAHKAVVVATAHFQKGALDFAAKHGIALVYVTEGRFTFVARRAGGVPVMSAEDAWARFGIPHLVGVLVGFGATPGSMSLSVVQPGDSDRLVEVVVADAP